MRDELNIDDFVTHTIDGIANVNESIDALHTGDCLRAIVKINSYNLAKSAMKVETIENVKCQGGMIKRIKHDSTCNNCTMTFSIFLPAKRNRYDPPPPVLFYLSGLSSNDENGKIKGCIFESAAKYGLCVVFPDTSARGVEVEND